MKKKQNDMFELKPKKMKNMMKSAFYIAGAGIALGVGLKALKEV
jgi:hypothetical protein